MEAAVITLYLAVLTILGVYGFHRAHLVYLFWRHRKHAPAEPFSTAAADNRINTPSVAGIPGAAIAQAQRANARIEVASTNTREHGAVFKEAKDLFAQKKYNEALATLDTIQRELLNPAQAKAVDELRAQINQARGR